MLQNGEIIRLFVWSMLIDTGIEEEVVRGFPIANAIMLAFFCDSRCDFVRV